MIRYFNKGISNMIHMVGDFPAPRTMGASQCGQYLDNMTEMTRAQVRRAPDNQFCLKCSQLLGLK